jgi:hypothetical protein
VQKDKSMAKGKSPLAHYFSVRVHPAVWALIVFVFASAYAIRMASDAWITFWTRNQFAQSNGFYIGIYGAFVCGFVVWTFTRGFGFSRASVLTGERMHEQAMDVRFRI